MNIPVDLGDLEKSSAMRTKKLVDMKDPGGSDRKTEGPPASSYREPSERARLTIKYRVPATVAAALFRV